MKKFVTASLFMLALAVMSATIGYSAFPIASKSATTATVASAETAATPHVQMMAEANEMAAAPAAPAPAGGSKSQLVALLLVIFVGTIGIHRFYLGYTWQGIVQLLTGGLCGIWTLIDLIRIITGDLQPKNGSYDKTL